MIGNRPSSLDITRYCGLAGRLGKENPGAGRSALMSKAFHARMANSPEAETLFRQLSRNEQDEMLSWPRVADLQVPGGPLLRYDDAWRELQVGMTRDFHHCAPDDPACLTGGTLDMAWLIDPGEWQQWASLDGCVVCLADIKRTRWTTVEGPSSLQLKAYALALAAREDAAGYFTGLWIAEEGQWEWSDHITLVGSAENLADMREVSVAAENLGEGVTGQHCTHCYQRLFCPAWCGPAPKGSLMKDAMAQKLTEITAPEALLEAERLIKLGERAKENVKAWIEAGNPLRDPNTGRVYEASTVRGRESVSVARVREAFGDQANQVITIGQPYKRYGWKKGK